MNPQTPTSEWPALKEVLRRKAEIVYSRWKEHKQHPVEHGAPRTYPERYLAGMVQCKANRIWSNLNHGGTPEALLDSVLDLSNYADFLAALILEMQEVSTFPMALPEPCSVPITTQDEFDQEMLRSTEAQKRKNEEAAKFLEYKARIRE